MKIQYQPIGLIHTPFTELKGMPIQPTSKAATPGTIEVFPEYQAGLKDLEGFSHVILIYHFHKSQGYKLQIEPFLDTREHGVFATRVPKRPNQIGLSVVRLLGIDGGLLNIDCIDVLNGTPLLDIKPYIPGFQPSENIRIGWLNDADRCVESTVSDDRFVSPI